MNGRLKKHTIATAVACLCTGSALAQALGASGSGLYSATLGTADPTAGAWSAYTTPTNNAPDVAITARARVVVETNYDNGWINEGFVVKAGKDGGGFVETLNTADRGTTIQNEAGAKVTVGAAAAAPSAAGSVPQVNAVSISSDANTISGATTVQGNFAISGTRTIDMGSNKITAVAAGVAGTDAVNVTQLQSAISGIPAPAAQTSLNTGAGASISGNTVAATNGNFTNISGSLSGCVNDGNGGRVCNGTVSGNTIAAGNAGTAGAVNVANSTGTNTVILDGASGNVTANGGFTSGSIHLGDATSGANNAQIGGTLQVTGTTTLNGGTTVKNTFSVDSNGDTAGGNTLSVDGNGTAVGGNFSATSGNNSISVNGTDAVLQGDSTHKITVNSSGTTVTGALNTNGIANTGTISSTGNITAGNNITLNATSGNISSSSLTVSGQTDLNGATNNLGTTQISTNTIGNTTDGTVSSMKGGNATVSAQNNQAQLAVGTNNVTVTNTGTTVTGTTNINTTGSAATTIGAVGNTSAVQMISGAGSISVNNGTNTLAATTNNITGVTNINVSNNAATNINTGTSTSAVTIGNALNTTSLSSATNNIGVSSAYATANNIGTNNAYASTNSIGNSNAATTVNLTGGTGSASIANNAVSMGVTNGGSFSANAASATIQANGGVSTGTAPLTNGYSAYVASQALSAYNAANPTKPQIAPTLLYNTNADGTVNTGSAKNYTYTNKIEGNTLVNGDVYINGKLDYVSNSSASTTVTSSGANGTILSGADGTKVTGSLQIVAKGATDSTGATATQASAALTLTNGVGNTHGVQIYENRTVITGGVNSTQMVLGDNAVTFSNVQTGNPVQLKGVDDGTDPTDAVNVRQLKANEKLMSQGIAATAAMANIPQVDESKTVAVGVGLGSYNSEIALALGATYRFDRNAVARFSVANARGGKSSVGVGAAWSF